MFVFSSSDSTLVDSFSMMHDHLAKLGFITRIDYNIDVNFTQALMKMISYVSPRKPANISPEQMFVVDLYVDLVPRISRAKLRMQGQSELNS